MCDRIRARICSGHIPGSLLLVAGAVRAHDGLELREAELLLLAAVRLHHLRDNLPRSRRDRAGVGARVSQARRVCDCACARGRGFPRGSDSGVCNRAARSSRLAMWFVEFGRLDLLDDLQRLGLGLGIRFRGSWGSGSRVSLGDDIGLQTMRHAVAPPRWLRGGPP